MIKTVRTISFGLALLLAAAGAVPLLSGNQTIDDKDRLLLEKIRMTYPDVRKGEAQLKKKQLAQAERTFLKVLEQLPENAQASFDLAETYYELGQYDKGLAAIDNAEKNVSLLVRLLYRQQIGQLNQMTDDRLAGSDSLQALRQQLGSSKSAGLSTGPPTAQNQANGKAGEQEQKSEVFVIPAEYSYVHGNLLFKLKRYQEALDQYLKAVDADPRHGKALNNVANIYFMAKQYDKSLDYIEKAEAVGVPVNPDFKKAVLKALGK
jgi:tetratricopeptide (TPR) repeat protein